MQNITACFDLCFKLAVYLRSFIGSESTMLMVVSEEKIPAYWEGSQVNCFRESLLTVIISGEL